MRATRSGGWFLPITLVLLSSLRCSLAQEAVQDQIDPRAAAAQALPQAPNPALLSGPDRREPSGPLTLGERFKIEARVTLGLSAFVEPAFEAGVDMADPPRHYPREWRDGAGAFGRNYGAELARHTAGGLTRFTIAAIDREDPRYYPSKRVQFLPRIMHAIEFTISNRTMSGHRTLAVSNFAGAAAAGFVGMPYEPAKFNDVKHATTRAAVEFGSYGAQNLVTEFSPDLYILMRNMHFPEKFARVFLVENPSKP